MGGVGGCARRAGPQERLRTLLPHEVEREGAARVPNHAHGLIKRNAAEHGIVVAHQQVADLDLAARFRGAGRAALVAPESLHLDVVVAR